MISWSFETFASAAAIFAASVTTELEDQAIFVFTARFPFQRQKWNRRQILYFHCSRVRLHELTFPLWFLPRFFMRNASLSRLRRMKC